MRTQDCANHFAAVWVAAWKTHDLERILSHCVEEFEMSSPYSAQLTGEPSDTCKGRKAVMAKAAAGRLARRCAGRTFLGALGSIQIRTRNGVDLGKPTNTIRGMVNPLAHSAVDGTVPPAISIT